MSRRYSRVSLPDSKNLLNLPSRDQVYIRVFDYKIMKALYIDNHSHIALWLTMMEGQKSVTLCWRWFSRWGRECVTVFVAEKGGLISKNDFDLGRMAPSEWKHSVRVDALRLGRYAPSVCTCSVRAIRDILVAVHAAPGVNTMPCVAYCLPIAVWLFLLVLFVSYFKWTLWCCGQLWP